MKKTSLILLLICSILSITSAQKVRWSYKVEGSEAGAGAPNTYQELYSPACAAVLGEDEGGKDPKKKAESPGVINFYFMPFAAQQVVICENYNAGAIVRIDIVSMSDDESSVAAKTIYKGEATPVEGYRVSNFFFEYTKNIVCVNVYLDFKKVPGVNQLAGVGLINSAEKYTPHINLSKDSLLEKGVKYMNDDVSGSYDPTTPIISVDGKFIYFTHEDEEFNNQVYRATLGEDGLITMVEKSPFNIPTKVSTSSALSSISQDNNVAYVNDMTMGFPVVYKTYLKRTQEGQTEWIREKLKMKDFYTVSPYLYDCMSYDSKYYFVNMQYADGENKYFKNDLYVGFRNEAGEYENFINMGYDINTIGDEVPCFLAADNKTFVFSSNGHIGYGESDLYITKRLDDTWQNWSQPINMGSVINTDDNELYFTIDSKAENAYFVRDKGEAGDKSDLYRVDFYNFQKSVDRNNVVRPDAVVVIHGKVVDKKTNKTLQSEIIYTDILTGEVMGKATSNGETGEYTVALPANKFYSYLGMSDKYVAISENIDTRDIKESTMIEKDLFMVPMEVGQTIRLNNIFFDTAKSTLRPESYDELNKLLKILNDYPKMEIAIHGHTDWIGKIDYNIRLSNDRANAVMNYLLEHGIAAARMKAKGYGETKPIADNNTDEGKQTNRRVEFTIVK